MSSKSAHRKRRAVAPVAVRQAHRHSSRHRAEVLASTTCGCFSCLQRFAPRAITAWTDDGATALCPQCGIDSVLGDRAGYPITPAFLGDLRRHWFDAGDA
jgi:hypothetical protein